MALFGSIASGVLSIANPAAGLALKGVRSAAAAARQNWKAAVAIGAALILCTGFLLLRGEIRHRDKIIASQASLIAAVKKEVDRGAGGSTQAADAPAYIHAFVENAGTLKSALDRQSAALRIAQQDADAHVQAAHQAGQLTPVQRERDRVRQKIEDPARTTGLTPDEWSKL